MAEKKKTPAEIAGAENKYLITIINCAERNLGVF